MCAGLSTIMRCIVLHVSCDFASTQVKSILEDLDDAEYYGSDHEERAQKSGAAGSKETVEEELARLVSSSQDGRTTLESGGG